MDHDQRLIRETEQRFLNEEPENQLLNHSRAWQGGDHSPSDAKKAAAVERWSRAEYREKQARKASAVSLVRIEKRRQKIANARNFNDFVKTRAARDNPRGDFVRDFREDREIKREITSKDQLESMLVFRGACREAVEAGLSLWDEYARYKGLTDSERNK